MNCISKGMANYIWNQLDMYYCFYNWNYLIPHPLSSEEHYFTKFEYNFKKLGKK